MRLTNRLLSIVLGLTVLSGCATTYPCGEPSAGKCASVSNNYKGSFNNYTNSDDVEPTGMFGGSDNSSTADKIQFNFTKYNQTPADGAPLVSNPKMLRVWMTPYTDTDNIYHEQGYEYILTDKGHWLYGNNQLDTWAGIQNITLEQGGNYMPAEMSLPSQKPTINSQTPANVLNNYPAFNALKNQNVPVTTTTTTVGSGIDRTTIIP